mgnify:CR=1 FL=1
MEFGINFKTNQRVRPQKGLIAHCQCCNEILIPKCGKIRIHHWAHKSNHCDKWWEPESVWHRNWKNQFPEDWREIVKFDQENENEKHICDIYNPNLELVLEFQNSPISSTELESREKFYNKMLWVVNKSNDDIELKPIKDSEKHIQEIYNELFGETLNEAIRIPHSGLKELEDYREKIKSKLLLGSKIWLKELLNAFNSHFDLAMEEYSYSTSYKSSGLSGNEVKRILFNPILDEMKANLNRWIKRSESLNEENKYFCYNRPNRKNVWDFAEKPVFIDNGQELLLVKTNSIVKRVPKKSFIEKYGK